MIYCRNFLSEDEEEARQHQEALKERIRFAGTVGIEKIVCSTGVTKDAFAGTCFVPEKSADACVELAKEFLEEAEKNNVRLCWENCPMMGNIAASPDMWQMLFDRLDSDRIGLCYDPSHLVWQMIDPYGNLKIKYSMCMPRIRMWITKNCLFMARSRMQNGGATDCLAWGIWTGTGLWMRCIRSAMTKPFVLNMKTRSGTVRKKK